MLGFDGATEFTRRHEMSRFSSLPLHFKLRLFWLATPEKLNV